MEKFIEVPCTHGGTWKVKAKIYGQWALHKQIGDGTTSKDFSVTHVPSGLLVMNHGKPLCMQLVSELLELPEMDVDDIKYAPKKWVDRVIRAKALVRMPVHEPT